MRSCFMGLGAAVAIAGCSLDTTDPGPTAYQWYGMLTAFEENYEHLQAEAALLWVEGNSRVTAAAAVDFDVPGASRPWQIYQGNCAQGGPLVGVSENYANLQIDEDGFGIAEAAMNVAANPQYQYFTQIFLSDVDPTTPIACIDMSVQF